MGLLVDGEWRDQWYDTDKTGGAFKRTESRFRNWVTPDGAAGPSGAGGFAAESGRYHLYVSYACPWAHRALVFRALKGLEDHIGVSVVHPLMQGDGWTFDDTYPGATGDRLHALPFARDLYVRAEPGASGRVTVPILWDAAQDTIVSNESAEIIRMFNGAFDGITGNTDDYYPPDLRDAIEAVNPRIYDSINNGVYKTGFATAQDVYETECRALFDTLDWLEQRLSANRYLCGARVTEADWRLWTTLIRFDAVYHGHFKCNLRMLREYPNLWAYTRELYQWPGIAATTHFDHIRYHYYASHGSVNPNGIVPLGPDLDYNAPHGRGAM